MQQRVIAHRVISRAFQLALRTPVRRHSAPAVPGPVRFLVMDLHEKGGSVRSNLLLAGGLAREHPVEVLSLFVADEESFYAVPPGVTTRVLDDRRTSTRKGRLQRLASRVPSILLHPEDRSRDSFTLWTDIQAIRALRQLDGGWLVTTRPALHLVAARFAPPGVVVIAREHDNFTKIRAAVRQDLRDLAHGLDGLSVLTLADEHDYQDLLGPYGVDVFQAPNALDPLPGDPARGRSTVVLAAGRLTVQKGFDLLIDAFAPVAQRHPDWRLRIFGDGPRRPELEAQVSALGLDGVVQLLPATRQIGQEMAQAGIFVLSSRFEGFGRVVLESLSKALPVVSFDCPRGPGEIISPGRDGLLVPAEDVEALSAAILELIEDEPLRRRLGDAGPAKAAQYDLPTISARWVRELASLVDRRGAPR
ncbi:Glycosyltransferase involved in cell wall bisynthesis [Modestobacter sp. DSM 44400]|uniref:glycosyltransferase family 4 protein n=1 Tax=Modestobacter sp. DSM 44400 TaxID=1550230 RepID=UPI00089A3F3E|nr:glycosyltransferase family 4 protein [Modestobacter sp. DSM 44400]SDY79651.1 Glycosyltransferase involved in cell wall bisynthesis [Modestobacter sp. DSM 44400]